MRLYQLGFSCLVTTKIHWKPVSINEHYHLYWNYFLGQHRFGVTFIQTAGGSHWLEWQIVLYPGQYHQMQHLLILKVLHIGQVILVIWKFWTLEFSLQPIEVLKQQKQTGKKFCRRLVRRIFLWHLRCKYSSCNNKINKTTINTLDFWNELLHFISFYDVRSSVKLRVMFPTIRNSVIPIHVV